MSNGPSPDSALSVESTPISSLPMAIRAVPMVRLPNFKAQPHPNVDDLLLQVFREENIPFSFLENAYFKAFVSKLNRTYRHPSSFDTKISAELSARPQRKRTFAAMATPILRPTSLSAVQLLKQTSSLPSSSTTSKVTSTAATNGKSLSSFHNKKAAIRKPTTTFPTYASTSINVEPLIEGVTYSVPEPTGPSSTPIITTGPRINTIYRQQPRRIPKSTGRSTTEGIALSSRVAKCRLAVAAALAEARFVPLSVKSFKLNQSDSSESLIMVFAYTPQPMIVAHFEKEKSPRNSMTLTNSVNHFLSIVPPRKVVTLAGESSAMCVEFAAKLHARCPWLLRDIRGQMAEVQTALSTMLPMLNPTKQPIFDPQALRVVSEMLTQNPVFDQNLITDWAHWTARTGPFAAEKRPYAWDSATLARVDAYTWWNGFYADSQLASLYSMLHTVNTARANVGQSWTTADRVFLISSSKYMSKSTRQLLTISESVYADFNEFESTKKP